MKSIQSVWQNRLFSVSTIWSPIWLGYFDFREIFHGLKNLDRSISSAQTVEMPFRFKNNIHELENYFQDAIWNIVHDSWIMNQCLFKFLLIFKLFDNFFFKVKEIKNGYFQKYEKSRSEIKTTTTSHKLILVESCFLSVWEFLHISIVYFKLTLISFY